MYDIYDHIIQRDGSFTAGYKRFHLNTNKAQGRQFLFTTLRLMRVLEGHAVWQIGSHRIAISPGDIIAVNNVEVRQFLSVEGDFYGEIFAFLPTIFGSDAACLRLFYGRSPSFDPLIDKKFECYDAINRLLDLTAEAFASPDREARSILVSSLLISASALLLREIAANQPDAFASANAGGLNAGMVISETVRYINTHISDEFGVAELSAHVNLSRSYYSRLFQSMSGTTPGAFLARCRVQNAVRLMINDSRNILDAAMLSGFGSSSGFYKTFRAVCGMSPGEYLRHIRSTSV
jgi:AraC-like DNA-binding protein